MTHNTITGDRIATKPASETFRDRYELIWPSKKRVAAVDPDEPGRPKCGDCGGTLVVEGGPCPACAPTDDGPDEENYDYGRSCCENFRGKSGSGVRSSSPKRPNSMRAPRATLHSIQPGGRGSPR